MSFFDALSGVSASGGNYDATISVYGVGAVSGTFVDTSAFEANKAWIYTVIRGCLAVMAYIFNINQFYKLLNRGATIAGIGAEMQGKGGNKE